MLIKTRSADDLGGFVDHTDNPLMNVLMRTAAEDLDGVNELLELQARQIGRPIVVLPSNPDTTH